MTRSDDLRAKRRLGVRDELGLSAKAALVLHERYLLRDAEGQVVESTGELMALHTALVQQAGGGTGFAFSRLRPAGDVVASTHGPASGPVPFLRVFDVATDVVRQAGRRRGASMAVLHVAHPDVEAFVAAKRDPRQLTNFNLSVGTTNQFMWPWGPSRPPTRAGRSRCCPTSRARSARSTSRA